MPPPGRQGLLHAVDDAQRRFGRASAYSPAGHHDGDDGTDDAADGDQ